MKKIISIHNEQIKKLKKLQTRRGRMEQGLLLIEGEHLVQEAMSTGATFIDVFYREDVVHKYMECWPQLEQAQQYLVTSSVFKTLVGTVSPQGIAATIALPQTELNDQIKDGIVDRGFTWDDYGQDQNHSLQQTYLILDAVSDPGNLGTIIRTAAAVGVTAIFYGQGSADPFNDKVVRSSAGAIFRVPLVRMEAAEAVNALRQHGVLIITTALTDSGQLFEYTFPDKIAVILGNEGQGVTESLTLLADQKLSVPMANNIESLNVAVCGAVILYERLRQSKLKL